MTIREFTASLAAALHPTYPTREAEAIATLVVEYLLDIDALQRMMDAQETVPPEALAALPPLQARLLAHEPVQYVLGTAYFEDMALEVTPATLIPRPETEELVRVIKQEQQGRSGLQVLDVGTGSGCLAIALARTLPKSQVLAVDISEEALAVARRNAARYAPTVTFQRVDILQDLPVEPGPGLPGCAGKQPALRPRKRAAAHARQRAGLGARHGPVCARPRPAAVLPPPRRCRPGAAASRRGALSGNQRSPGAGNGGFAPGARLRRRAGIARYVRQAPHGARHPRVIFCNLQEDKSGN
ncbi:N5-glutamine methyltransferase family protein [Hymenobacter humi]|uniref:N5-glutamine methyltransferase family protein n=1 Tax=Hymenobacter humi TaxID=1411620 RepID=A0ABW2U1E7_9BACT